MMVKAHTYIVLFKDGASVKAVIRPSVVGPAWKGKDESAIRVSEVGTAIPSVAAGSRLLNAVGKMQHANSGMAAVVKTGKVVGVVTSQHAESVIALHLSNRPHG